MRTSGTSAMSVSASRIPRAKRSVARRRPEMGASPGVVALMPPSPSGPALTALSPVDVVACHPVHEEREHEQDEAGRDERGAVQRIGRRLVELVRDDGGERVALGEDVLGHVRRVADDERHRDRLADRPAQAEHRRAGDARAGVRQHRHLDHLPARRAERERGLLVIGRHGEDDLTRDRGDDRDDHDREDQAADEEVRARDGGADERQERERVAQPGLDRAHLRDEDVHAPEPVDDRGHRGEELHQRCERLAQPLGAQLGHVDARPPPPPGRRSPARWPM